MRVAIDVPRGRGELGAAVASPDEVAAIVAVLGAALATGSATPASDAGAADGARWKRAGRVYDAYDASAQGRHR